MFKGILIESSGNSYSAAIKDIDDLFLPEGDVTIQVAYSTLNYKDALAITGRSPVVRRFPMIPGIDLAGTVDESKNPAFRVGDQVILNGWGIGEIHWGGFAQKARVKSEWLLPLPRAFTLRQTMAVGTAGYTAMLCVLALERHGITPDKGDILVTGATGGVGSVAVAILSKLGYRVVALSGRQEEVDYLKYLGATEILGRTEFASLSGKFLGKERWAGAVDVAGSQILANICATCKYGGVITACGMAGGIDLSTTVAPFILRGVTLVGIDSVLCPKEIRLEAWTRLARDLDISKLEAISRVIGLSETIPTVTSLLQGQLRGRTVINVQQ